MRVYTRQDFLDLPEGTIFCKGVKWNFDGLCIKGKTWPNDFIFRDLTIIDSSGSNDCFDKLEDSITNGSSYPLNEAYARDGSFDSESLYLVFDSDDLIRLSYIFMKSFFNETGKELKIIFVTPR